LNQQHHTARELTGADPLAHRKLHCCPYSGVGQVRLSALATNSLVSESRTMSIFAKANMLEVVGTGRLVVEGRKHLSMAGSKDDAGHNPQDAESGRSHQ
jgi:hypothetical protein